MTVLPKILKTPEDNMVTLSDCVYENLMTVVQCIPAHVIMFATRTHNHIIKNLHIPTQECTTTSSDSGIKPVRDTQNTVILYMNTMPVLISQSCIEIANTIGKQHNTTVTVIVYNKYGDYKVYVDRTNSIFAQILAKRVLINNSEV